MKKIFTLMVMALMAIGASADTWTVAGSGTVFGSTWTPDDAANDMTSSDGVTYTLTKENVTLEKGVTYEFKVVKDHAWTVAYPGSNYTFSVDETATYTVTISFNSSTQEITVTTTKTGDAAAVKHTYSVIGSFFDDGWQTDFDMTETSEGVYSVVLENVAAGDYKFKVRTDHAWDAAYPSSDYALNVPTDASIVTITFKVADKSIDVTVEAPTAIENVNADKAVNGVRFNMAGQQVNKNYKGVVILNGKKMIQR